MALPGPFLAGQALTAGQLNDATQKTIASVEASQPFPTPLVPPFNTTETTIPQFTLGPFDQVAGALYRVEMRVNFQMSDATSEFIMKMRKDTPLTGTTIASWDMFKVVLANSGSWFMGTADFPAAIDEPGVTYYFSAVRFSGLGDLTVWGHNPLTTVTKSGVKISRVGYASEYVIVT